MVKLTERELELIKYLTEGFDNKQIAKKMFLTTATVKYHMTAIMNKLGVKNRTSVAVIAVVIGLVDYRKIKYLKALLDNKNLIKIEIK
ncbi:response regulator transcription factor [bacterium]|nr:response regulator transcription factor [bacterium]